MEFYNSVTPYNDPTGYNNAIDYRDFVNATLDLYMDQGDDFSQVVTLRDSTGAPLQLRGYSIVCEIKKFYNTTKIYPAFCEVANAIEGKIRIVLTKDQTALMDASRYVYRVDLVSGLVRNRVLDGQILVDRF